MYKKLYFLLLVVLSLTACHKTPEVLPMEECPDGPPNTYLEHTINLRIQNQEGKDLLWGENRVPDEQIQVLYRENGKKKVYFRKNVIAPWVHGFVVHRLREGEQWLDNGYLELYLITPKSPEKPESYTYLRLGEGKQQREVTLKAEWDYQKGKCWTYLKVLKVYVDNELFWSDGMYPYPILTIR